MTPALNPTELDPRWHSLKQREQRADFVYGVLTTGIYCRCGCASRLPRPENVVFHLDSLSAEAAGFRPCKRCSPELATAGSAGSLSRSSLKKVAELCRLLADLEPTPQRIQAIAEQLRITGPAATRLFKEATGLTPSQYRTAARRQTLQNELRGQQSVTQALLAAGFGGSGQLYERVNDWLGMAPGQYNSGAQGMKIQFGTQSSNLGHVLVAATPRGICCVLLGDNPEDLLDDLRRRFPKAELIASARQFDETVSQVIAQVEATPGRALSALPLDVQGTVFQQRVWQLLRLIPQGSTTTYSELASALGAPKSSRAVARACAGNPVAVLIPCHRVVRRDGSLSGYRWGVQRKQALLERERLLTNPNS